MGKHPRHSSDISDGSKEEEEVYLVEVITKARVVDPKERNFEYRVKWHGYTSDDDTWEPEKNVQDCTRLLKSFWKTVGRHHKTNPGPPGTEYSASKEWISKERDHFAEEIRKDKERKDEERKEKQRLERAKAAKKATEDDAPTQSRSQNKADFLDFFKNHTDSDDADVPLNLKAKDKGKGKGKEVSTTTSGASSSTIKVKNPQRPIIQTGPNFTANKFSGLKIPKKPGGGSTDVASPVASPIATPSLSRPKSKPTVQASFLSTSNEFGFKDPEPERRTASSNQFLPPRQKPVATRPPPLASKQPTPASDADVDNLLATIMPFGHAEAQKPENLASQPQPQPSKPSVPTGVGIKFQKNWAWTGELFIDNTASADRLCEITIHSTSETSEFGFRLSTILSEDRHSIRFSKGYTRAELNSILRGLRKVDQIAKIGHRKHVDLEPLMTFMRYLDKRKLAISSPAINRQGHIAEMIIFPSSDKELCERMKVPLSYKSADCLLLVLMPWHVPPSQYGQRYLKPDEIRESKFEKELEEMRKEFSNLASKPNVETALRILGFDASFVKFLPLRKYCIWSLQVDGKSPERGRKFAWTRPETKALIDVLSFLKAENVGYDREARVVFVHVGAVRSIRRLPGIVERRCKNPEVQFVTYGTHESVRPSMWGFHEIYPLGGIVTFTATALLENPISVAELIEQIYKHPHWECYILPSVLAAFVRLSCPGEDPLSVYLRQPYHFGRILDLIEEGKVALMRSPGLFQGSHPDDENDHAERDKWIAVQFSTISRTPVQLLEECWSTFVADYSNKTKTELRDTLEREIVTDFTHLQVQQTIRENYRRFVTIKAIQDDHVEFTNEGFEWRTVQEFQFGDDFPTHTMEMTRSSSVQSLAA